MFLLRRPLRFLLGEETLPAGFPVGDVARLVGDEFADCGDEGGGGGGEVGDVAEGGLPGGNFGGVGGGVGGCFWEGTRLRAGCEAGVGLGVGRRKMCCWREVVL